MELFTKIAPLADRIRPKEFDELIGQTITYQIANYSNPPSLILWGPPGSGKTSFSIFAELEKNSQERIILLIDEIHHLNKSQQDIFLPHLENGSVILFGTTTENPSFELRPALLSRCKVITFNRLTLEDLDKILMRAEEYVGKKLPLTPDARQYLCLISDGDSRYLLNRAEELLALHTTQPLTLEGLKQFSPKRAAVYDKSLEEHYNLISAFHKSLRGSDPDAALYWMNRMLTAGEDPLYITRRLIRFASEDVGLADPEALPQALAAHQSYNILGSPEGEVAISNAVVYLAMAPKSNAGYKAYNESRKCAELYGSLPVPMNIRNAPTKLMKELGYGAGYVYDHNTPNAYGGNNFFPDELSRKKFYSPVERGFERELKKRSDWLDKHRKK